MLERLGVRADTVADGREAVAAVRRTPYDLVLMDMQMPVMDGLTATRRIRAHHDLARQPHIVAMTANAMAGDRERCLAAGMDGYIAKPVHTDELAAALHNATAHTAPRVPAPATAPDTDDAAPASPPAFNVTAITDLVGDDPEFIRELLTVYLSNAPETLSALHDALDAEDYEALRDTAHAFKSSSYSSGAAGVAEHLEALETWCRTTAPEDPATAHALLAAVDEAGAAAQEAMNAYLNTLPEGASLSVR
jgi:CheY-like chemotaxis protein/HPt (histidine-containing phosphotransfer) domain-containing protein